MLKNPIFFLNTLWCLIVRDGGGANCRFFGKNPQVHLIILRKWPKNNLGNIFPWCILFASPPSLPRHTPTHSHTHTHTHIHTHTQLGTKGYRIKHYVSTVLYFSQLHGHIILKKP